MSILNLWMWVMLFPLAMDSMKIVEGFDFALEWQHSFYIYLFHILIIVWTKQEIINCEIPLFYHDMVLYAKLGWSLMWFQAWSNFWCCVVIFQVVTSCHCIYLAGFGYLDIRVLLSNVVGHFKFMTLWSCLQKLWVNSSRANILPINGP